MTRGSVSARIQELKTKVMELSPETMLTEGAEMSRLTTLRLGGPADLRSHATWTGCKRFCGKAAAWSCR